jgi:galactokinase
MTRHLVETFKQLYHEQPRLFRAHGRVNLIGEHTDYNDGFVLPMAIDRATWIAFQPRHDRRIVLRSADLGQEESFALDPAAEPPAGERRWIDYARGTVWAVEALGMRLAGWDGVVATDVPIGAGLSSSAAFELAVARASVAVSGGPWNAGAMARAAQRAENEWVGLACGIMDHLASACAVEGTALLIDCRSLALSHVPLPAAAAVVVLDTGTRRGLVESTYNLRRNECRRAASALGVASLRDATLEQLDGAGPALGPIERQRARHVISENARTVEAAECLRRGNLTRLGVLLGGSHRSLRDDYEVSGEALDAIVECARRQPGCYAARLTGAGFAGCAVALVDADRVATFCDATMREYRRETGLDGVAYPCRAAGGAALL